jgi:hypothetical protein
MIDPSESAEPSESVDPSAVAEVSTPAPPNDAAAATTGGAAAYVKTFILTAATMFIAAFAWYLTGRFTGTGGQWIVKYSAVALLVGMATATAVIGGSGRRGAGATVAAAMTAMLAIVIGKLLIVALTQLPQQAPAGGDAAQFARLVSGAFTLVDPLFFAVAAIGSAIRFILARP